MVFSGVLLALQLSACFTFMLVAEGLMEEWSQLLTPPPIYLHAPLTAREQQWRNTGGTRGATPGNPGHRGPGGDMGGSGAAAATEQRPRGGEEPGIRGAASLSRAPVTSYARLHSDQRFRRPGAFLPTFFGR